MKKILPLLLLLLASCAHKIPRPAEDPSAAGFGKDQVKREKFFRYIQGKLDLRVSSPKLNMGGSAKLFIGEKGETRLEVVDPLGRTQFIGHLAGRAFLAYWPRQERAYRDSEEGRHYLARYLGLTMTFRELIDLIWGLAPRPYRGEAPKLPWGWDDRRGLFLATLGPADRTATLGWNQDKLGVGSFQWTTPGPAGSVLKAHWDDFSPYKENGESIPLANTLKLVAEREGITFDVGWNDVESKTKTDFGHTLAPTLSDKTKTMTLP